MSASMCAETEIRWAKGWKWWVELGEFVFEGMDYARVTGVASLCRLTVNVARLVFKTFGSVELLARDKDGYPYWPSGC
jgi:hypothetical protein